MDNKKTGEFLRSLRKAKGYTQAQVAELLFLSPKTISKWETGEGAPDINIMIMVAEIYDVTVDEILRGRKNTPSNEEVVDTNKKIVGNIAKRILDKFKVYWYVSIAINLLCALAGVVLILKLGNQIGTIITLIALILSVLPIIFGYMQYKDGRRFSDDLSVGKAYEKCLLRVKKMIYYFLFLLVLEVIAAADYLFLTSYLSSNISTFQVVLPVILTSLQLLIPLIFINKVITTIDNKEKYSLLKKMFFSLCISLSITTIIFGSNITLTYFYPDIRVTKWYFSFFLLFCYGNFFLFRGIYIATVAFFIGSLIYFMKTKKKGVLLLISTVLAIIFQSLTVIDFKIMTDQLPLQITYSELSFFFTFLWSIMIGVFFALFMKYSKKELKSDQNSQNS